MLFLILLLSVYYLIIIIICLLFLFVCIHSSYYFLSCHQMHSEKVSGPGEVSFYGWFFFTHLAQLS